MKNTTVTTATKPQPTAAMLAVIHAVQSAGLASLVTLLTAIAQYLTTSTVNIHGLLYVLGGGFLTALGFVWKAVSSNPNLIPAIKDAVKEVLQEAPWLAQDIAKVQKIPEPATAIIPTVPPARPMNSGGGNPIQFGSYDAQQGVQPVRVNTASTYQQYPPRQEQSNPGLSYADMQRQYYPPQQPAPQQPAQSVQTAEWLNSPQHGG